MSESTSVIPWQPLDLNQERLEIMRRTITPTSATEGEFKFFVEWCRQTGLNPFLKQAFLVERYDSMTNSKRHEPLVAEAGFAARADALLDFRGMRSGVVYEGDEFAIDEAAQTITHKWNLSARAKGGHKVVGAWAHGRRDGREVEITFVTYESRVQKKRDGTPNAFWARDPAGQLRKCARADQYRRLYPNIFSGWYDEAEMRGEEKDVTPAKEPVAQTVETLKTDLKKRRMNIVDVDAPKPSPPSPAVEDPATVSWGKNAALRLADLTDDKLEWYVLDAEKKATANEGDERELWAERFGRYSAALAGRRVAAAAEVAQ